MSTPVRTRRRIAAAGATDPGLQREVNEDRFHVDESRGVFIVIDGVGGHAAGGKAADVALSMLRERLERETGTIADRLSEAIAIANNEIYRLASGRPEWDGMACVLTAAIVKDGRLTIGHVGDTRLYKASGGRIEKITRDHSPVGEREDARELSEAEAMRHPRRNEVYRDVGSAAHAPGDPDFVEVHEVPFEPGEALLLCSDGLTDLIDSSAILRTIHASAGDPAAVVRTLISAAKAAGGKDNVTVVYVEGENFQASVNVSPRKQAAPMAGEVSSSRLRTGNRTLAIACAAAVLLAAIALVVYRVVAMPWTDGAGAAVTAGTRPIYLVRAGESIGAALNKAEPGSEVVVEPGEYQERVTLATGVRLVSRVPRGATIRLPATVSDAEPDPAVIASGVIGSELVGFRVMGDARTPLGVGVFVAGTNVSLIDVEISGAATAAVAFASDSTAALIGSAIHDNPGAALSVQAGATPRISHNVFSRNGLSQRTSATFAIDGEALALLKNNVFVGVHPEAFGALDEGTRRMLAMENWFLPPNAASHRLPHASVVRRP